MLQLYDILIEEPEGSALFIPKPAIGHDPKPLQFTLNPHCLFPQNASYCYPPILIFLMVIFHQVFIPKVYIQPFPLQLNALTLIMFDTHNKTGRILFYMA